jgi:hypothetical protein
VYDPKITGNTQKSPSGISGTRIFEYLVIPRSQGNFAVRPVEFAFFDLSRQDYVVLSSPEIKIDVEKGEGGEAAAVTYGGVSQKNIQYIGSDIRYLKSYPFTLFRTNQYFFRSTSFFLLLIIPAILAFAGIILIRYRQKRSSNKSLMNYMRANRIAKSNLKKAKEHLEKQDKDMFYIEISKGLWGYLANKFNIPLSELSTETVGDRLKKRNVSEETVNEFIAVLNDCEFARFAPGDSSRIMNEIYEKAIEVISKIERELK